MVAPELLAVHKRKLNTDLFLMESQYCDMQYIQSKINKMSTKHKSRSVAYHWLKKMLSLGRIQRPAHCVLCGGGGRIEAHHPDYANFKLVVWLCVACHRACANLLFHESLLLYLAFSNRLPDYSNVDIYEQESRPLREWAFGKGENKVGVRALSCSKCGHEWRPRTNKVLSCPSCKRYDWNKNKDRNSEKSNKESK
jgi:hypothetical protein